MTHVNVQDPGKAKSVAARLKAAEKALAAERARWVHAYAQPTIWDSIWISSRACVREKPVCVREKPVCFLDFLYWRHMPLCFQ